jgi:hypothetical protein
MAKRSVSSPDRADSLMYACALSEDLPIQEIKGPGLANHFGVNDNSEPAMWARQARELDLGEAGRKKRWEINPVFGVPDDW